MYLRYYTVIDFTKTQIVKLLILFVFLFVIKVYKRIKAIIVIHIRVTYGIHMTGPQ
jgi:hypothetical protein